MSNDQRRSGASPSSAAAPDTRKIQPSDPTRQQVELRRGPASYCAEGVGPPIVAIHGLPGGARDFRWLAPLLAEGARVIRVELPGFGETPVETEPDPSPLGRARFVLELVAALELERPLLLGHSMGCVSAIAAVDLQPKRFRGLALLASPGLRPHAMLRQLPFATVSRLLERPRLAPALAPLVRRLFALGGFTRYPVGELYRTIHCVAQTSLVEHAARVTRLRLPTLHAHCEDDPLIEAAIGAELADACPSGPRLRFPSGGHNPQRTRAHEIAELIAHWLPTL